MPYCFVCSSIQDALKLIYKITPVISHEPRDHIFFWLSVCQQFTCSGMEFVVSGLMTKRFLNVILLLMCVREGLNAPNATHCTVLLTTMSVCSSQTVNKREFK